MKSVVCRWSRATVSSYDDVGVVMSDADVGLNLRAKLAHSPPPPNRSLVHPMNEGRTSLLPRQGVN
jgi:hypothetical protein